MAEATQRTVAVWTVLVLSFIAVGSLLYVRDELSMVVVALYWYPAVVLTMLGIVPAPWEPFVE